MQYVDDMTRVMQLTKSWQKGKTSISIRSRLQSANYPSKHNYRVPHLTRNYNTIEQNIFAVAKLNKTISHIHQTPKPVNDTSFHSISVDEDFYQFPSNQLTKQENQNVINRLQQQFEIFKQNKKSASQQRAVSSNSKKRVAICRNSQSLDDQNISAGITLNDNYLVNQRTVMQKGIKYPYQLLLMNQQRQKILSSLIDSTENTLGTISNADDLDEIKKKDSSVYQNEVKSSQNDKKRKELLSRGYMTNAMYSLMALNRKSQKNVKSKYQMFLPKDSRFYEL